VSGVYESSGVGVWECGSVGEVVWECGIVGLLHVTRPTGAEE
jgi:hypothetical protein